MSIAYYIARRAIAPTHNLGVSYSIEFFPRELSPKNNTIKNQSISLSGHTQTRVQRREQRWMIKTQVLTVGTDQYNHFLEFMESVDQFEPFAMDIEGSVSNPTTTSSVILTNNYQRQRYEQSNEYSFSFEIRILP